MSDTVSPHPCCHRLWPLSRTRAGGINKNAREGNVLEATRALSKGPCSIFIKIRSLTSMMDVRKETTKPWILTHILGEKGVLGYAVLGIWVNTKQDSGAGWKVVYSKHEALPLFTYTGLGDRKENVLPQGQQGIFCLISSVLGNSPRLPLLWSIALFTRLPNLILPSCESSFLLLSYTFVLYWGAFAPFT